MDTCEFSYVRRSDDTFRTVRGIEQSWDVLCKKLSRTGAGIPGATYYFTVTFDGPDLFAVNIKNDAVSVYYHDNGQWNRYVTATDIKFGMIADTPANQILIRATTSNEPNEGSQIKM